MKKKASFKKLLELLLTFMKIGSLTFGGGYAMIPIISREASEKRNWIDDRELLDIIAIAESTPGPISINAATYVGYKVAGFWGSVFATLGLVIPSFVIIFIISFFYKDFISWAWVNALFKGLKIGVILLLFSSAFKLMKRVNKTTIGLILFIVSLIGLLVISFFQVTFSYLSICFIVAGLITGILVEAFSKKEGREK